MCYASEKDDVFTFLVLALSFISCQIMVMMVQLVSNHSCFSVIFARIKTCKLLTYEVYLMFIFMSMFYDEPFPLHHSVEGKLGMSDVSLLSGISGLSFWDLLSCFYCLVLLLFLFCHFSANGPFSCLLFFLRKLEVFFVKG